MSEDKFNSWPIYKLQSEAKRWGIVPHGDKPELVSRLVLLVASSDGPIHPTPDFQAVAEDSIIYLQRDYFELQEICYERKLPTTGGKVGLVARLMNNDKQLWLKVHKKEHTDTSDPDRKKRSAYTVALNDYTDIQQAVWNEVRGEHVDGKVDSAAWENLVERCKAANTGLERGKDPVLDHGRGLKVLSTDRSWSTVIPERELPSSRYLRKVYLESEESIEKEPAKASSNLRGSAVAELPGDWNTPDPNMTKLRNMALFGSYSSKTEPRFIDKCPTSAPKPKPTKQVKMSSPHPLSDEALLNIQDQHAYLVAPHSTPMLERYLYDNDCSFALHIPSDTMSVRGDRLLGLKELLGKPTFSDTPMNVEILGDPTGFYIFYGRKAEGEYESIRRYWLDEMDWCMVIFGTEIEMNVINLRPLKTEWFQWDTDRMARKANEESFNAAYARAKAEVLAGKVPKDTPSEMPYSSGLSSSTLKMAFRYSNYISLDEVDVVDGYTKSAADIKSLWGKVWFMSPLSIHGDPKNYFIRFGDTDEGDQKMEEALKICFKHGWKDIYSRAKFTSHGRSNPK